MKEKIILYGMRGCGKSKIGYSLSKSINYNFFDLDDYFNKKENKTIEKFVNNFGWDSFRKKETYYLKKILSMSGKNVISLGGGTIIFKKNRKIIKKHLKNSTIIYLEKDINDIINKNKHFSSNRPNQTNLSFKKETKKLFKERKKVYESNNHFKIYNKITKPIKEVVKNIKIKLQYGGITVPIVNFQNQKEYNILNKDLKIEFIEIRVDFLLNQLSKKIKNENLKIEELIFQINKIINIFKNKKIILTFRTIREGGKFKYKYGSIMDILLKFINKIDFIDIELNNFEKVKNKIKGLENKIIISYHNFKYFSIKKIKNKFELMNKYGCKIKKIAITINSKKELLSFNSFLEETKQDKNKIIIGMGKLGRETRINLIKKYNGFLTFGTFGNNISASGQIEYNILYKKIYNNE